MLRKDSLISCLNINTGIKDLTDGLRKLSKDNRSIYILYVLIFFFSLYSAPTLTQRLAGLGSASAHRRNFSRGGGGGGSEKTSLYSSTNQRSSAAVASAAPTAADDPMRLIGTGACPRFDECPVLEPLVCKKIAHERLTALAFREDCFVTACQDGYVYTWARPGRMVSLFGLILIFKILSFFFLLLIEITQNFVIFLFICI